MVTLDDYGAQGQGFMGNEQEGVGQLLKAMQAGQITGRETADQLLTMEPLKVESLERTIRLLEFRLKDVKLWNSIPKLTAYNTVEEFLQLASYGTQRGGFYREGELSAVEDSKYIRKAEHVKYMQVTGEVTLQAQMVRSFVDAMRKEVENKAMWITRLANTSMTKTDADIIPEEFNGIYKQHASIGTGTGFLYPNFEAYYNSGTVIDMRGRQLRQEQVEDGAIAIDSNFGNIDSLYATTSVISALAKDYFGDQRILMNGSALEGTIGVRPKVIATTIGDVNLMTDKMMKTDPAKTTATAATTTLAPAAPASVTGTLTADTTAKFTATPYTGGASELGNVYYAVSAINRFGESALTAYGTAITLAAGQRPDLTITAGTGPNPIDGYVIYRTKITAAGSPAGLDFYPLFRVSVANVTAGFNGAAPGVVGDRGYFLPGLEQAFATEMVEDVLSFKQLAPLSKLDLGVQSMSRRFISFLFGTPQLYTPKKVVRYINVSATTTA